MSSFKKLIKSDISVVPYEANKQWTIASSSFDSYLKIYASSVGLFFMTWMINVGLDYIDIITYLLIPIPFILLFYLTIIIHKIKN